jgi:2-(1,2-epoxy-1,2-dihydrophenyl)acetyl-CoA isomerase
MSPIHVARDGAVARLLLDRPDAGNAIDCADDPAIRCVVLSGIGRFFCVGGDVAAFAAGGDDAPHVLKTLADTLHGAILTLVGMRKPLIVLVNGPAAGAGLSLALLGDVVIAARSAHFTAAYTAIGLTPDGGMSWFLPRLVGLRRAQAMILTNQRVTAEEAVQLGLITEVVEDDDLVSAGDDFAARFVEAPMAALGATRGLLLASATLPLDIHLNREAATIAAAGGHTESREGVAAFLARRKPDFQGD